MKFNWSQVFKAHLSTSVLKSIDSFAAVASFQLVPKYISKVKVLSKYFILKHCFLGKWWQRDKVPNCSYLMGIDP